MEAIHDYTSTGIGVLLAAIAAIIYTAYFNHLTSKNDLIKDYLQDLQAIEDLCRDYWLFKDPDPNNNYKIEKLGHELRAKVERTSYFEALSRDILGKKYQKFSDLDLNLYMAATGGNFQTSEFSASPETYGEIMAIIAEIRNLLRTQRNSMFWVR